MNMKYIKYEEAMEMLGVKSKNTMLKYIDQGLKYYGDGKQRRFKESDIIDFMENGGKAVVLG